MILVGPPYQVRHESSRIFIVCADHPRTPWLCEVNPYAMRPTPDYIAGMIVRRMNVFDRLRNDAQALVRSLEPLRGMLSLTQRQDLDALAMVVRMVGIANAQEVKA